MGHSLLFDNLIKPHLHNQDPFLIYKDGSLLSYQDFFSLSKKVSQFLLSQGVSKGDRVLFQLEKSVYGLAVYAACIMTGAIYVPINDQYTLEETKYFISDSQPKIVFCSANRKSEIDHLNIIDPNCVIETDPIKGLMQFQLQEYNEIEQIQRVNDDEIIAFLYTSGTTGKSKAVALSQNNLFSNASVLKDFWQITKQDRLIHMLPIFHTHGLFVAMNTTFLSGLAVYFYEKFSLSDLEKIIPNATLLMGVPTYYKRMNESPLINKELTHNMRLFISGSAPLSSVDHQEFFAKTGHTILERYGMTETNMNTSNPYEGKRKPGSVGLPLPNIQIRIRGQDTKIPLPPKQKGMIEIKGPNVFHSYWNNDQANQESFTEDGFFITGDLGYLDEEGYVHISGREKDLIISGGFNIYPKEIEDILNGHEAVVESAVMAKESKDLGEVPIAVIVTKNKNKDLLREELSQLLSQNLAKYKIPKEISFLEELPRNAMGKIQKSEIQDRLSH
jgi:malonyl-CoA/methylmalonyl-CoA synthetase